MKIARAPCRRGRSRTTSPVLTHCSARRRWNGSAKPEASASGSIRSTKTSRKARHGGDDGALEARPHGAFQSEAAEESAGLIAAFARLPLGRQIAEDVAGITGADRAAARRQQREIGRADFGRQKQRRQTGT